MIDNLVLSHCLAYLVYCKKSWSLKYHLGDVRIVVDNFSVKSKL